MAVPLTSREVDGEELNLSLTSVFMQSYGTIDTVVFDGTGGNVSDFLKELADEGKIKYFRLPQASPSKVWQEALAYCDKVDGFVSWLTEGTVFTENHIENLAELLATQKNVALAAAHGGYMNGDGSLPQKQPPPFMDTQSDITLMSGNDFGRFVLQNGKTFFGGSSALLVDTKYFDAKAVIKAGGARYALPYDVLISLAAAEKKKIVYVSVPTFFCVAKEPRKWYSEHMYHWRDINRLELLAARALAIRKCRRQKKFLTAQNEASQAAKNWQQATFSVLTPSATSKRAEKQRAILMRDLKKIYAAMDDIVNHRPEKNFAVRQNAEQFLAENAAELDIKYSPSRLAEELQRPWVLLKRRFAMGDVICIEPIARKLHAMGYCVFVATHLPELFDYGDDVAVAFAWEYVPDFVIRGSLLIDLDESYENDPQTHIVDAYANETRKTIPDFSLTGDERIPRYDDGLIRERTGPIKKIAVGSETRNHLRDYPRERLREVLLRLKERGCQIYEFGTDEKSYLGVGEKCFGLPLHDAVSRMAETDVYIGMDSGLMHMAQAIRLPVFIFFGATIPNVRVHDWKRARVMWRNTDTLKCAGCWQRTPYGSQIVCQSYRDGLKGCMNWRPDEVLDAFFNAPYDSPPKILWDTL